MKELYIDFDGVILDTIPHLYQAADEAGRERSDSKFYETFDFKKILKDENILNDSINCIQKIIESKKFNISVLTHINSLQEGIDKVEYLRKFFKDITIILVPKKISKTKMIHTKGAILIDDYAHNLREWESEGGISVRFSQKRNGKGFLVVDKLDQIIDMF